MLLKAVAEHKDTATTPGLGIMSVAGLAAAGNVPFVTRAVWRGKSNYVASAAAHCGRVNLGRGCFLAAKGGSLAEELKCRITRPEWCYEMVQKSQGRETLFGMIYLQR